MIGKACIDGAEYVGRRRSTNATVWGAIETDEREISKHNYHADRNCKPFATLKSIIDSPDLYGNVATIETISDEPSQPDPKKHVKYIISSNPTKFHHIPISLADVI